MLLIGKTTQNQKEMPKSIITIICSTGTMKESRKQKCWNPSPADLKPPLTGVRLGLRLIRVSKSGVTMHVPLQLLLSRKGVTQEYF